MSSNLTWRPVHPAANETLPDRLKFALKKRHGDPVETTLSSSDIPYIEGLVDAGVEGAERLLEIICEVGEIEIWEEF